MSAVAAWTPPPITAPGRGTWTKVGGATPFYQVGVGRHAVETSPTFPEACVTYGVMAIKDRVRAILVAKGVSTSLNPADGLFDQTTESAVVEVQRILGFSGTSVDGVVGPKTTKALFAPLARQYEVGHAIPLGLLRAGIDLESEWDVGGQGTSTPFDLGLMQVNTAVYPTPLSLAFNPTWAIHTWSVQMAAAYASMIPSANPDKRWQTEDLRLRCTVGEHFAPGWAALWWATGVVPPSNGLTIDVYADAVLRRRAQFV